MSVIRVGSSGTYASGWDAIFGGGKAKKAATKKTATKKASAPKPKKAARKKAKRR